jgi:cell division protein FtsL
MRPEDRDKGSSASLDQELVLSSLEPDQLAALKKKPIPRRHLRGFEKVLLWSLRIYVLFMVVVVIYQVLSGAH